ncbi:MAG: hypothetical protein DME26_05830, partial [Verrucomicrobia bacterium]
TINAVTGAFSWTPSEAQGPSTNVITVRVNDNGSPNLSDTSTFTVIVREVNAPPVLTAIANQTINEGSTLILTAVASDADQPANALTFSLVSPPAGASINPSSGVLTWIPSETQGPGTHTITVRVTDNGVPPQNDTKSFTVVVNEVNSAPVLDPIFEKTIKELNTLAFTITADDSDVPTNVLTYSLLSPPSGASINPSTGVFTWTPTAAQGPNTYVLTVRVTDNGSPPLSDTKDFTIVVTELNSAPVLAAVPDQTVNEGSTLNVMISASDPDIPANTLTFSLVSPPSGASINASSGVFTWTPTEAQGPATNTVTARVTDNGSPPLSDTRNFTVVVNEVNSPPVLAPIANRTVDEGSAVTITNSATDPDIPANSLTYSLDSGAPAGASIDPSTGLFTWTPSESQGPGTYPITVRVSDNGSPSLSNAKSFTVVVNEVNNAPVLGAVASQSVDEGSTLTVAVTAVDVDQPANTLTFSLVSSPSGAGINPSTGVFTWTPTEAQGPGTYTIRVRVADNGSPNLSDTNSFIVAVNEVNSAPVLGALANRTINEGSTLSFAATATDPDIPVNALTYSLEPGAPSGASINPSTGAFSWTPTEAQGPGSYVINVRVIDNGTPSLSDTKSFTVAVNEVNTAPVLAAIANQTINEGSTLTVTAGASDADVPANTLIYSLDSGAPAGASIHPSTGVFTWTPTEAQGPSTNLLIVRVIDNGSPPLNDTKNFTVVVSEVNSAPVLATVPDQMLNEGSMLVITNTATDSDVPANSLTFGLGPGGPSGVSINPTSGVLSWTPDESLGGIASTITVRVTDNGSPGLSDTKSFTVVVNEVNHPPVLAPIVNQTVNESSTLTLAVSASDPDVPANNLTFSLLSPPAGATINPVTGLFSWQPTEAQGPSTNTIRVRVTDNGSPSLSDTTTFTVTVSEVNSPPLLVPIANQAVNEGGTLSLAITATDPDIPANTLAYSLAPGFPAGAVIDSSTGVLTWSPSHGQAPSTNVIGVRVTDNGSPPLSDTKSFLAVVGSVNSAPVLAVIPNQNVNEGTTLTLTMTATDPDGPGDALTFSLLNLPAGAALNPVTGVFTWVPSEAQGPGTNTVTVRVTDNGVPPLSDTKSFTVVVNEVNTAPVLPAIANQTIDEGSTLVLTNTATDADIPANTLAYSLAPDFPAGAAIDSNTGVFTWTPSHSQAPSTNMIGVRVTDDGFPPLSDTKTFLVVVGSVNHVPVLTTIPNQNVNEGTPLMLTIVASDPDGPVNALTFSLLNPPAGASINPASGVFTWVPSEAQGPGINSITVRVTDNGSPPLSDTKSFSVVVNEVNSPPVLTAIPNQTVNGGATLLITTAAIDPDIPANLLTYSLEPGAPAGAHISATTGVLTWMPDASVGTTPITITVRVSDNGSPSLSDAKSFTVTVNAVNRPPMLAAIANQTVNEENTLILTASATDPDLPANTLTFSLLSAPAGAAINPVTGVFSWQPAEAQGPSTNRIRMRVTDNGSPNLSDTNTFTVTVNEVNRPPVLAPIGDRSVNEGTAITLTVTATDPDIPANTLTYSLDPGAPAGASIDPSTGLFTWTPNHSQVPSTSVISVHVTDSGSPPLSDTKSFLAVVGSVNSAPVLAAIPNQTVNEGTALALTITATDANGADTLSYSLGAGAPAGAAINPVTGVFTWTPTEEQGPGTNIITVHVSDNGSPPLSDTKSFAVFVNEVNSPPVLA